jgi:hypothetical protein
MTRIESGSQILKTDTRGRVHMSAQRRRELLAEYDRSGLSAPKFAALSGIKYQTLAGWLHRRRKEAGAEAAVVTRPAVTKSVEWFETVVEKVRGSSTPVREAALVVRLPSGAALEVTTLAQAPIAAAVLRAWEKAAC